MSVSIGSWPRAYIPQTWEFYLKPNSNTFISPITRSRQTIEGQGQMYVATGTFRILDGRPARTFEAFLDKFRGQVNYCSIPDFGDKGRALGPCTKVSTYGSTTYGDTSIFDDGSKFSSGSYELTVYGTWPLGARHVLVRGFPQSTTQVYAGDNVQLGDYLYRLTDDAEVDRMGRAHLILNRGLMGVVPHGTALITQWAQTPMRLIDDDQTRRSMQSGALREYTLTFEEVFFLNEQSLVSGPISSPDESPNGTQGDRIVDADGNIWSLF